MQKSIRNAILAAALLAGLAPACAQVPPPVPALPDTERRTSYIISASTCACNVGFQIFGDSTDVGNWIEVWINGTRITQSGNWNLTSPTGSIATIPRPITDAVLTFTTAQTGTVQIVGARRPRRTSQFNEGAGVPTRNFNVVLSDLTAQLRENWDKTNDVTGRAVLAPPGETLALLPALASRMNMGACFDSSGNLAPCVAAASGTFIAGSGIGFAGTNPTTISYTGATYAAGSGINFTGSNPTLIGLAPNTAPYVLPSDYGAVCNGVTNDAVALQNLLNGAVGKTILLPAATCVTNTTLLVPSNTTILGQGREVSVLTGNALPLLSATDKTNIVVSNFWMKGTRNVVSWAASVTGAMALAQTVAAVGDQFYSMTNMKFSNFNTSYWINVYSTTNNFYNIKNFTFQDNYMLTASGDIPADADPLNNNNYGLYVVSSSAGKGRIDSPLIKNNLIESTGMCFPVTVSGNSYKMQITENLILNAGVTNPSVNGHCLSGDGVTSLSYGLNIYDAWGDGNPPTNFLISSNSIIAPYATGIYIVGDGTVGHTAAVYNSSGSIVSNNLIDGQVAQTDVTLPRAGIVVSLMTDIDVIGNKIRNSFGGIASSGQTSGVINIVSNSCTTAVVGGASTPYCYKITSGPASALEPRRVLRGNYGESLSTTTGSVVLLSSSSGAQFNDVEIISNTIAGAYNGLFAPNSFLTGLLTITENKFNGKFNGSMIDLTALPATTSFFSGNQFFNDVSGVSGMPFASLPAAINGSQIYLSNGAPGSAPCTGASTGSLATRQNGAWKCF